MPKIQFKEETLNGRAFIIGYADREYLTLRIPRGDKKYSNISLGTTDIKIAHDKALDVYAASINQPLRSRNRKFLFSTACKHFLAWKEEQARLGTIKESAVKTYAQRIHQRIIPFAKLTGINNIGDIRKESFENYGVHYRNVETKGRWKTATPGLSVATINSDLTTLNDLMIWMVERNLLDAKSVPKVNKLRSSKEHKDDANPAFMPDEWDAVKSQLMEWVQKRGDDDELDLWRRRWMFNWIFFMYHFGGRYHEAMLLQVGDVNTKRMPDGSLQGIVEVSAATKTGRRTSVMNGYWIDSVKSHLEKGVKLRNQIIEEHNQLVESGEIKKYRWRFQGRIPFLPEPEKDTLLFLNPIFHRINKEDKRNMRRFEAEDKLDQVRWTTSPYSSGQIRKKYQSLVESAMVFKFPRHGRTPTDFRRFTLHSLRSTHITHRLLSGVRIRLIADNVGSSEADIERIYCKLNHLLNVEELGMHRKVVKPEDHFNMV